MYHKITIVGHLGRDPELRYTPQGSPVCNFSLAANHRDKNGIDHTTWFRVSAWGSTAEACNQYLAKGRLVLVEGTLRPDPATGYPRIWTADDGVARANYEVVAHTIKFLGGAREAEPEQAEESGQAEQEELPF